MRKLNLLTSFVSMLALGTALGFASPVSAQSSSDNVDVLGQAGDPGDQPVDGHRRHPRPARELIHAVRENCACGDVACATAALDSAIAELLGKLPESCDEACQTKAAERLAAAKVKILERVQAAADDPTLCEKPVHAGPTGEPPVRPTGEPGGRGPGHGGRPGRP